jgi:RNA polymerase sigma factor (sigma-70 family)
MLSPVDRPAISRIDSWMDPRHFEQLLATYAKDLESVVRRYAAGEADRDDLRQEISIALWRALPRFRGEASERTYLLRVAHNRAITFCLRQARNQALLVPLREDLAAPLADSGEHDIDRMRAVLETGLSELPAGYRDLLAYAAAGYSPKQIGQCTGRTAGAVRVALHRARTAMRRWLSGSPDDTPRNSRGRST